VDIKKSLYGKVARVIKPDAIVVTGCDHDDVRAAAIGEHQ